MASITSLGAGSNLELDVLLDKLVTAEKKPKQDLITQNQSLAKATISALGAIKSKLSAFQDALAKLKDPAFFNTRSATSSDTTLFTVSAQNTADAASYDISVINLAKANKIASANFASPAETVGSGTLSIGVGSASFDVEIVAGTNDTLAGVRDAINNAPNNTGVKASLLTVSDGNGGSVTKLVLTANNTGAASQISIGVADDDGNNTDASGLSRLSYNIADSASSQFSEINAAIDARITVDGFEATSSSNVFANVISGVTITALKGATNPAEPPSGQLVVAKDTSALREAVQSFVGSYNELVGSLNQLTTYNKDTGAVGPLMGDSSLRAIQTRLRSIIGDTVSGAAGDFSSLSFIGLSTNKDGSLTIDSAKLSSAIDSRFDDVGKLFSGSDGAAGKLSAAIDNITGGGGVLQNRESALNDRITELNKQQVALDLRIESFTKRYRAQFAALDALVTQLNQTNSFLTQQLDATAKIISRKSN